MDDSAPALAGKVQNTLENFTSWLNRFGETSFDHQSFFAGPLGGRAKALYYKSKTLGTIAVAPMIFFEAFLPSARRLFWQPLRFPIADAHYAMGFAFLAQAFGEDRYYSRAVHFLERLIESRCPAFQNYCWGYPFDWVTRNGTVRKNTPLVTTTPYAFEAFQSVYEIDGDRRWTEILNSITEHVLEDIKDFETSPGASSCSYTPFDREPVVNAAAYRAAMLTQASRQSSDRNCCTVGEKNLNFVLRAQNPDGSWYYSVEGARDFVDHFHTCFVLKALSKIERLTGHEGCRQAIERGLEYYRKNLLDEEGLPKPFSKAPRLTVYRRELYDYAESINLCLLTRERHPEMQEVLDSVLEDLLARWIKPDGSFRSRELLLGWDNVPMHRWAQSQMFRSLALWLKEERGKNSEVGIE